MNLEVQWGRYRWKGLGVEDPIVVACPVGNKCSWGNTGGGHQPLELAYPSGWPNPFGAVLVFPRPGCSNLRWKKPRGFQLCKGNSGGEKLERERIVGENPKWRNMRVTKAQRKEFHSGRSTTIPRVMERNPQHLNSYIHFAWGYLVRRGG